ncbi:MAG: YHS domain-containing (seleno)protein [Cyclobacteriaceae bacterium]|jgi:YHS domain-containing protein|nr:YHS domain-containing (seleno)protein [Cyclobacteriaceae bacterium]
MKSIKLIFSIVLLFFAASLHAQTAPIDENGLALGGFDVVAYFSGKAKKGDAKINATFNNANYLFSSTANRDAFKKNPTKYLPQYDGYCAWAVGAKNAKFPVNPETFKIIDNKLYLFYNGPFNGGNFNTLVEWNTDEANLLKTANANWPTLKNAK